MSCETTSQNATAPSPAIAPGAVVRTSAGVWRTPPAGEIEPRQVAEGLIAHFGPTALPGAVGAAVPGFDAPFYQAGLAGYSDEAMRLVARRHGCPYCVTEALLDRTLLAGGRGFAKADLGDIAGNVPGGAEDYPLAGQIMGSEPAEMAAAAVKMIEQASRSAKDYRRLAQAEGAAAAVRPAEGQDEPGGAPSFAAIDVNLACPVKKIQKKARGGHWLAEPEGASRLLEAVREAVPTDIPVTVKLRCAFDEGEAARERFFRVLDAAYDIGCAWVTVHARTVRQKYVGPSRWDRLREIVAHNREADRRAGRDPDDPDGRGRVVFGSGDIWSAGDVFRMIAYTGLGAPGEPGWRPGVAGASVARGCIGDPWVFTAGRDLLAGREPRAPGLGEQRSALEQHFELALAGALRTARGATDAARLANAEQHTARHMRKIAIQFARHHPEPRAVRDRFVRVNSAEDWRAVLAELYPAVCVGAEAAAGSGAEVSA